MTDDEATKEIDKLILDIKTLESYKSDIVNCISSIPLLISSLNELKSMIEINNIKLAIVDQIKFLITNKTRKGGGFEDHVLHTVIYGNPGTGKTTVARILAQIWMSLGFISSSPETTCENNNDYKRKLDYVDYNLHQSYQEVTKIYDDLYIDRKNQNCNYTELINKVDNIRNNLDNILGEISFLPQKSCNNSPKFTIATRADLISGYLGQTAIKTKAVLDKALGGVLFIDEAYSLCTMDDGYKDKFGEECLTVINEYMSLYSHKLIIIFAGYKDKLMESIFAIQPGLLRRCAYFFQIEDYTNNGLAKIFIKQLAENSWTIDNNVNVSNIIEGKILNNGGGTNNLAYFTKIAYSKTKFSEIVSSVISKVKINHDSIITESILQDAISLMKNNTTEMVEVDNFSHMYN